jgi:hypothetical protein
VENAPDVPLPLEREMLSTDALGSTYSADRSSIAFHGWSRTHVDARYARPTGAQPVRGGLARAPRFCDVHQR